MKNVHQAVSTLREAQRAASMRSMEISKELHKANTSASRQTPSHSNSTPQTQPTTPRAAQLVKLLAE